MRWSKSMSQYSVVRRGPNNRSEFTSVSRSLGQWHSSVIRSAHDHRFLPTIVLRTHAFCIILLINQSIIKTTCGAAGVRIGHYLYLYL